MYAYLRFRISDHGLKSRDELCVRPKESISRSIVDHEEVRVVAVERDVLALDDLHVGVVAHVVELVDVGVDEEVFVADVAPRAEAHQLEAPAHLVPVLHHELALPDRVPHQLHRARVGAARQDERVRRLGGADQTALESLLFPRIYIHTYRYSIIAL